MTISNHAPRLGGQSVIGEDPGHSRFCRERVTRVSAKRALPPAAAVSLRCTRNGSFCPSRSSSVIEAGGVRDRRRHPAGMLRCAGVPSIGARYTDTFAPPGVKDTQAPAHSTTISQRHRMTHNGSNEHTTRRAPCRGASSAVDQAVCGARLASPWPVDIFSPAHSSVCCYLQWPSPPSGGRSASRRLARQSRRW